MGTGKSSAGRLVAQRLDRQFVDMDGEIERRERCTISDIFSRKGEPYFRQVEREVVKDLCGRNNLVVAAGGGVVIDPENVRDFGRSGVVICLNAIPSVILRRVAEETHRPLIEKGDKARHIVNLLEIRKPLYDAIPNQLDTTRLSPERTADQVIEMYKKAVGDE